MTYDAVIFDMDGVLIDSEILYCRQMSEYSDAHGYGIPMELIKASVGGSTKSINDMFVSYVGDPSNDRLFYQFIEDIRDEPVNYTEILFPGVIELLEFLKENRVKTSLASSTDMVDIIEALDDSDTKKYFDVIQSGEMFTESKPNPEIYLKTAALMGVDPAKCIVIEDSAYGIEAGKAAGCYVIARREDRFGFRQDEADIVLRDHFAIKEKIAELLGL